MFQSAISGTSKLAIATALAVVTLTGAVGPADAAVYRTTGGVGSYQYSLSGRSVPVSLWVTQDNGGSQSLSGWVRYIDSPKGTTPWQKLGECVTLSTMGVNGATCKFPGTMPVPYAGWHRLQVAYGWYRPGGWEYLYETSAWFNVK